jgi:DNA (cytosine-5)-methyltransferase 1
MGAIDTKMDDRARQNLRLNPEVWLAVDVVRTRRSRTISRNAWVAEAILEKLEREPNYLSPKIELGGVMFDFFEFFAGGGMVRAGLGDSKWRCRFANDFDHKKSAVYRRNWGDGILKTADVRTLTTEDMPGSVDLAWASFPCQDLSLAGGGAGLKGDRSGTFWPFWEHMKELVAEGRAPRIIALENVCGTLTSHNGKDFAKICETFQQANYTFGAVVIDAALFVPQSRPRLFVIGVRGDLDIPSALTTPVPSSVWHPRGLRAAFNKTPAGVRKNWVWWSLPTPAVRNSSFADFIEDNPADVDWHNRSQTRQLLAMMSDVNRAKLDEAKASRRKLVGALYKRTRVDEAGWKVQRAEIRFDDIAGCLRTPAGGSSRQLILVVEGEKVRSRLISGRETARLMGLPDEYELPANYNEAYHLTGDGVVVPAVRHLAEFLFEPLLSHYKATARAAA